MNPVLRFASVAIAMAVADWCWTKYMMHAAEKRAVPAAWWSSAIVAISIFTVTSYVDDHRLALAAILGAWIGTYAAVRHSSASPAPPQ